MLFYWIELKHCIMERDLILSRSFKCLRQFDVAVLDSLFGIIVSEFVGVDMNMKSLLSIVNN
jgi:hypothetical protein